MNKGKEQLPKPIDPRLPVQTSNGHEVTIVDVLEQGRYHIVGVINYGGGRCEFMKWDEFGVPMENMDAHALDKSLENVPGFEACTVWLNIYEDADGYSTGPGYPKESLAKKYLNIDSRLPAVDSIKTTLVFIPNPEPTTR